MVITLYHIARALRPDGNNNIVALRRRMDHTTIEAPRVFDKIWMIETIGMDGVE